MNNTLCIIPARGGSKGIQKKNIRILGGKPLISYSIHAALEAAAGRVIVSTDDPEIARIALNCGAEVPFQRPRELATDTASSLSVLLHAVEFMEESENLIVDTVVFIQPTSPFVQPHHIKEGMELLQKAGTDSVVGITEALEHPYFQYSLSEDLHLHEFVKMKQKPLRRQDLPAYYVLNSAIFISRREYYKDLKDPAPVFNPRSVAGLVMEKRHSVDIDSPLDLIVAEAVFNSGVLL